MEEIKELLLTIQRDINETKNSIKNSEANLLKKIDDKFDEAQKKIKILENKVEIQENRLDFLEKQIRSRNILIFGVQETENNYKELTKIVLDILNINMRIKCSNLEIEYLGRKGKKSGKPRPIIVTFTTFGRKIEIIQHKKTLEKYNYYIKEDYPPKVLEKRKILKEQARAERENGNKTYIKYDKLIIIPQNEQKAQEKIDNKQDQSIIVSTPGTQKKDARKYKEINTLQQIPSKNSSNSRRSLRKTIKPTQLDSFFSRNPEPSTSFDTKEQEIKLLHQNSLPLPTRVVAEEE